MDDSISPPHGIGITPIADEKRLVKKTYVTIGIALSLIVLVFLAFGESLHYGFLNWDDVHYLTDYPEVKSGISPKSFLWAWTQGHHSNWHPLTTLSLMLDVSLFGENATGFHAHNLLLHALASAIFFLTLTKLTNTVWRSALAAAIFAVHPLRVESVVWISERKDVLSGLFLMATLYAYAAYIRSQTTSRYVFVVVCFALGLLSKSTLVPLPFTLLLLDIWPLNRLQNVSDSTLKTPTRFPLLLKEKIPLFILSAASCLATLASSSPHRTLPPPPFDVRLCSIPLWILSYLRNFFYPSNLAAHYPVAQILPPFLLTTGALAALALISITCFKIRKQFPNALVAWSWFLIGLVPVIGIIPPGSQIVADRYTYFSQLAFGLAIAWLLHSFTKFRYGKLLGNACALFLLSSLLFASRHQTVHWKSDESLWRHTLAVTSNNAFAYGQLGDALTFTQRFDEAEDYYRNAIRLDPNLAGVLDNLALIRREKGDLSEAETLLKRAVEATPWYLKPRMDLFDTEIRSNKFSEAKQTLSEIIRLDAKNPEPLIKMGMLLSEEASSIRDFPSAVQYFGLAIKQAPTHAQAHFLLGNAYFRAGQISESISSFRRALELDPQHARAAHNLAWALNQIHQSEDSVAAYKISLTIDPHYLDSYQGLADVLLELNRPEEALNTWLQARKANPNHAQVLYKLGWLLATHPDSKIRNGKDAEGLIHQAFSLLGQKQPLLYDALAAAFAEQGRYQEAIQAVQIALELQRNLGNTDPEFLKTLHGHLEEYQQHRPIRSLH